MGNFFLKLIKGGGLGLLFVLCGQQPVFAQTPMVEPGSSPVLVFSPLPSPGLDDSFRPYNASTVLLQVYEEFARVFMHFTSRSIAPPDGIERPNIYETFYADYLMGQVTDRCRGTIQGATNTRYLSGPYFYSEQNGGFGVRCNLLSASMPNTILSVQISPVSGSIVLIRYHSMVTRQDGDDEQLPTRFLNGAHVGLEAMHQFHAGISLGMRLYARAEVDIFNGGQAGVGTYEAAYLKFDFRELLRGRVEVPVSVTFQVQHFERGDSRRGIYEFEERTLRGAEHVRSGFEGFVMIALYL